MSNCKFKVLWQLLFCSETYDVSNIKLQFKFNAVSNLNFCQNCSMFDCWGHIKLPQQIISYSAVVNIKNCLKAVIDASFSLKKKKSELNKLIDDYIVCLKDLEGSIKKIALFLDKPLSDKDVQYIMLHCSFDNMKKNENVNYEWMRHLGVWDNSDKNNTFIRKGNTTINSYI